MIYLWDGGGGGDGDGDVQRSLKERANRLAVGRVCESTHDSRRRGPPSPVHNMKSAYS